MTADDILQLRRFVQRIIERPRSMDEQPHTREGVRLWCEDWHLIELGKCLFHSEPVYRGDPPPRRLRCNPLWSQEAIILEARQLQEQFPVVTDLIAHLEARRNGTSK